MKKIKNYLYKHRALIIAYFLSSAVFALVSYLYGRDFEMFIYPFAISLFVFVVIVIVDINLYFKYLNNVEKFIVDGADFENHDEDEEKLLKTIKQCRQEINKLNNLIINEKEEMTDFYMMWIHQIKTPISAMKLLLDERSDINLEVEVLKIEQYVNMVLNYVRLNQLDSDLVIEEVKIDDVIKKAIKTYSTIFIQKHLTINYTDSDATILSDYKWIVFVIEQLLSNALKYTKKGGIEIKFIDDKLSIKDSGIGIDSADLPRVFDKGYTGKIGRSSIQATGLGLYLSKKIIDHLGHKITIESKLGEGTIVTIDFSTSKFEIF